VQDRTQLPGTEAPRLLRHRDRAIQQGLVQVVGDEPHPEVKQGALTEGRMLGAEAVQHHLPALVHHGQLDRVPVADVTIGLQQRREGQQPRVHRLLASRLRAIALGQYVLKVCVEELMAVLAQKHKKLSRLACACGYFLLFQGQCNGRVPHSSLLKGVGSRCSSTYQSTDSPLLSTLCEPLPKHLISVLGAQRQRHGQTRQPPTSGSTARRVAARDARSSGCLALRDPTASGVLSPWISARAGRRGEN